MEKRGTVTRASAFIQFITFPTALRASPCTPTRKPGWSTSRMIGMLKESHSTRKLVALSQASTSIAPPLTCGLLAMKPTLRPSMRASAVVTERP